MMEQNLTGGSGDPVYEHSVIKQQTTWELPPPIKEGQTDNKRKGGKRKKRRGKKTQMEEREEGESCDKGNKAELAMGEGGTYSP